MAKWTIPWSARSKTRQISLAAADRDRKHSRDEERGVQGHLRWFPHRCSYLLICFSTSLLPADPWLAIRWQLEAVTAEPAWPSRVLSFCS